MVIILACGLGIFTFSVQAQESIKIASLYSFTGLASKPHLLSIQGIRFAVEEINANGGVLGIPLELIEIDTHSTPIGSKVAAEKAVQTQVTAMLGSSWSSHTLPVAKVAQANSIPLISSVSTHPDITRVGDYIFRACFNDLAQGWAMAKFARQDLKLHRAVIFEDITSDYSIGLASSFATTFERLGGDVLRRIPYKRSQANHQDLVSQAVQFIPDVLFVPGHDESALILQEAQRLDLKAVLLGADGWDVESFYNMGGRQIQHGFFSTHWSEEMTSKTSHTFVRKYKREGPIFSPEALAYDAVYLLADAIRRAGRPDRRLVRDALAQTHAFQGVTGKITLGPSGDPLKNIVIMELKNGIPHYLKQIQSQPGVIDFSINTLQDQ